MLLADERCLQPDLVRADRIVPVASVAASRDLDASSSTQRATRKSPQRLTFTSIDRLVFAGLYRVAPGALYALKIVRPETVIRVPASEHIGAGNQDRALAVQRPRWRSVSSFARSVSPTHYGAHHGFMASFSSSASMSDKPPLQSIWRGEGDRRPKGGRHSFIITPTASRRWTCSWFRPHHRKPGLPAHDRQRQRHRVHLECHPGLAGGARDRVALHRARQAHAERLLREF